MCFGIEKAQGRAVFAEPGPVAAYVDNARCQGRASQNRPGSAGIYPEGVRLRMNPLHDYQQFAVSWIMRRLYVEDKKGSGLFLDPG